MTTSDAPQTLADAARVLLRFGREAAAAYGRADLDQRLRDAGARLDRPDTLIGVVGEFKQGKSSLVNGLLAREICPVDDDLATSAVTVLRHGDEPTAAVHRVERGEIVVEAVPLDRLAEYVSEHGNPENARRVELVEVRFPHPLLEQGLTIVDTPGVGGLHAGYRAATLAFLRIADAAVFATDASAELSAPEVEFLREVREAGPRVVVVLTKIDLYPHWLRILELDEEHLDRAGVDAQPLVTSAMLRAAAVRRQDRELNDDSGFPDLLDVLRDVQAARTDDAGRAAVSAVGAAASEMRGECARALDALSSPAAADAMRTELEDTQRRLEALRAGSARWQTALQDGFSELNGRLDYDMRSGLRTIARETEARLDEIDPGREWDALSERVQGEVGALVSNLFSQLGESVTAIRQRIAEILAEDGLSTTPSAEGDTPFDVRTLWRTGDLRSPRAAERAQSAFGTLRGAQGGILLMGMLANIAGLALVGPVLIGVGAVFGGKALLDQRRQGAGQRRQQARTFVRQFVDDVQFEVAVRLRELARDEQRALRDAVSEHLRLTLQAHTETARRLRASLEADEAERERRAAVLRERIAKLDELLRRVKQVIETANALHAERRETAALRGARAGASDSSAATAPSPRVGS